MSDDSKQDPDEGSPRRPESARQLLSTGGLLLAVLAILGLGAALAVDPSTSPQTPVRTAPAAPPPAAPIVELDEPPPTEPAPTQAVPETPVRETSLLATRATEDARRIAQSGGAYTLQLLVGCKEETVERYLARSDSSSLYLLPAMVKEQSCFRVTFGSYASQPEAAAAASSVPQALRSGAGAPSPKKIADLML